MHSMDISALGWEIEAFALINKLSQVVHFLHAFGIDLAIVRINLTLSFSFSLHLLVLLLPLLLVKWTVIYRLFLQPTQNGLFWR